MSNKDINQQIALVNTNLPYCKYGIECKDYSIKHRSNFEHFYDSTTKECAYFPCKLLHDKVHIHLYKHKYHYKIISKHNKEYNSKILVFNEEVWQFIHKYIYLSTKTNKYQQNVSELHINTIKSLLCTSKLFNNTLIFVESYPITNCDVIVGFNIDNYRFFYSNIAVGNNSDESYDSSLLSLNERTGTRCVYCHDKCFEDECTCDSRYLGW